MGLLINADREKHLDRYKVFVGCLSRSNQVEESGRDGRLASRGCYERLVWLYGFVKHGCKQLMGKFLLVLSNPCVKYAVKKLLVHQDSHIHLLMDTSNEHTNDARPRGWWHF
ncbi:hypothetical protein POTOM_054880 [Populus tomentosa]|uniref:Uncharacterized protein n=1 Tax=Populus tomentosa TaxID=118781 RepID=A0A8X8C571_POPTO|nr:hypothetical protein POTOM_054880 [Populus tomentosa]